MLRALSLASFTLERVRPRSQRSSTASLLRPGGLIDCSGQRMKIVSLQVASLRDGLVSRERLSLATTSPMC
jgi:hypothetical protein